MSFNASYEVPAVPEVGLDPEIQAVLEQFPEDLRPYLLDGFEGSNEIVGIARVFDIPGDRRTVVALLFAAAALSRTVDLVEGVDNDEGLTAALQAAQDFIKKLITSDRFARIKAYIEAGSGDELDQALADGALIVSGAVGNA